MRSYTFARKDRIWSEASYRKYRRKDSKKISDYGIVIKMFLCLGINLYTNSSRKKGIYLQNVIGFAFAILLHLAYVDFWLMSCANLKHKWHEYQVVISYIASYTFSLLLWYVLYMRKKSLTMLLHKLDSISNAVYSIRRIEIVLINFVTLSCVIFLPVLYSGISLYLMNREDPRHYYAFYTYGYEVKNFTIVINTYLFLKVFTSVMLDPIFTTTVTILYCILCFRCYKLLLKCYHKMKRILHHDSTFLNEHLLQAIKDYTKVIKILDQLQNVFSFPAFLLVLIDSTSSFTTLASTLLYSLEERTSLVTAENIFVFVYSALLMTATIGFAAQIPIIIHRIRDCMIHLSEKILWHTHNSLTECSRIVHIRTIQQRPVFILSGCDIIYFTRGAILTALGTLFTYGFLVIQLK